MDFSAFIANSFFSFLHLFPAAQSPPVIDYFALLACRVPTHLLPSPAPSSLTLTPLLCPSALIHKPCCHLAFLDGGDDQKALKQLSN